MTEEEAICHHLTIAGMAQLVAQLFRNEKVGSSSLSSSATLEFEMVQQL